MKRLKLYLSLISLFCINSLMFSQVGINTENPAATLDVVAANTGATTAEGFIAPRLTGDQLTAKNAKYTAAQNGTIVYVTTPATAPAGKTTGMTLPGYYYYDATANNGAGANSGLWIPLGGAKKQQFYMPSVVLPTVGSALPDVTNYAYSGGTFTVKLFDLYKKQYGTPQAKSLTSATLSVAANATEFDYFVLYYDPSVFTSVTVSPDGVLSYKLDENGAIATVPNFTVVGKTFMNIMFKEK